MPDRAKVSFADAVVVGASGCLMDFGHQFLHSSFCRSSRKFPDHKLNLAARE